MVLVKRKIKKAFLFNKKPAKRQKFKFQDSEKFITDFSRMLMFIQSKYTTSHSPFLSHNIRQKILETKLFSYIRLPIYS